MDEEYLPEITFNREGQVSSWDAPLSFALGFPTSEIVGMSRNEALRVLKQHGWEPVGDSNGKRVRFKKRPIGDKDWT